ncbi:MAG: glycosyltransferase family 4 protein [Candidatus Bathyarchaeota archaeon]
MNILIIGNSESVHTARFAAEFTKRGHQVHVLSTREYFGDYAKYPVDIRHVRFLRWVTKFFQFILGERLRKFSPEVSPFYHPSNFLILLRHIYLVLFVNRVVKDVDFDAIFALNLSVGGLLASRITRKVPKVGVTLGTDVNIHKFPKLTYFINHPLITRYVLKRLTNVLNTGDKETFEPLFERRGFTELSNFEYFGHFGVETIRFSPVFRDEKIRSKLFNIKPSTTLALCHRPPRPKLDFEDIIKAVAQIVRKHKDFVFAVFTGGNDVTELKKLVHELNVESHVLFIGAIPYNGLHTYVTQGDIFIDPANIKKVPRIKFSGISGSILEAMSCGLIPVVSNRPSINWILPPEAKPFIFEDFETDLTDAIERAINERDNQRIKDAMRSAVVEKANWERNIPRIEKMLSIESNDEAKIS